MMLWLFLNELYVKFFTESRHTPNTTQHEFSEGNPKLVPFEFNIKIPPPLKRGVDYGFKPSKTPQSENTKSLSKKGGGKV